MQAGTRTASSSILPKRNFRFTIGTRMPSGRKTSTLPPIRRQNSVQFPEAEAFCHRDAAERNGTHRMECSAQSVAAAVMRHRDGGITGTVMEKSTPAYRNSSASAAFFPGRFFRKKTARHTR